MNTTCSQCNRSVETKPTKRDKPRLPRGWKVHNSQRWCDKCWRRAYKLRCISIPVAKPIDCTWAEFRPILKNAWSTQTALWNWLVDELYARDVRRSPESPTKMPKQPKVYLYPESVAKFPSVTPTVVAATENQAKSKWGKRRYNVLWTNEEHLPRTKYPAPAIVTEWSIEVTDDDRTEVIARMRIDRQWYRLRLNMGKRNRRMRPAINAMANGSALLVESKIYRRRAEGNDRSGKTGQQSSRQIVDRAPESGQKVRYDVMVGLVAWLPRREDENGRSGQLFVHTDSDSLILALDADNERLWVENADHILRLSEEIDTHTRNLNRWSDDQKAEQRPIASFAARRQKAVAKFHRRQKTWLDEIAAHVVKFANRRRFSELRYDDSDKGFISRMNWFYLRTRIAQVCDEYGIVFTHVNASDDVAQEPVAPLAED